MKKGKKRDLRYEAMTKRGQAEALNTLKGLGPETPMNVLEHIVSQAVRMGFNNALNIRQGASYSSF